MGNGVLGREVRARATQQLVADAHEQISDGRV